MIYFNANKISNHILIDIAATKNSYFLLIFNTWFKASQETISCYSSYFWISITPKLEIPFYIQTMMIKFISSNIDSNSTLVKKVTDNKLNAMTSTLISL
jgi:hypothetical protein